MKYLLKLDISREWQSAMKGKYNLSEFCAIVGNKLDNISLKNSNISKIILDDLVWAREVIVELFRDLGAGRTTIKDFDAAMEKLYSWADFSHSYDVKSCEVII